MRSQVMAAGGRQEPCRVLGLLLLLLAGLLHSARGSTGNSSSGNAPQVLFMEGGMLNSTSELQQASNLAADLASASSNSTSAASDSTSAPSVFTTVASNSSLDSSDSTSIPSNSTSTSSEPTLAPSEPTSASSEITSPPSEPTSAPSEPTSASSESTSAPSEPTSAPSESTSASPETSADSTSSSTDSTSADLTTSASQAAWTADDSTGLSSATPATGAGDLLRPVEPLEVVDLNKDPYRNTTEPASTTAGNHVTSAADDVSVEGLRDVTESAITSSAATGTTVPGVPPSEPALVLVVDHGDHGHLDAGRTAPFSRPTEAAGIMAGVLVSLAVAGYVGLMAWRKILERRYGNREMLIDEDDDLQHFEL